MSVSADVVLASVLLVSVDDSEVVELASVVDASAVDASMVDASAVDVSMVDASAEVMVLLVTAHSTSLSLKTVKASGPPQVWTRFPVQATVH